MQSSGTTALVSCYELGHQPLAVAGPAGFLRAAELAVTTLDLSVEPFERLDGLAGHRLIAISVPMHTALHVGVRAARHLRRVAPDAHLCLFGHYAWLNADYLLEHVADSVTAGEIETTLVQLARALQRPGSPGPIDGIAGLRTPNRHAEPVLQRLDFAAPSRDGLPELSSYARLLHQGDELPAGAVEASRGCLHRCRHCPVPAVYDGRFFVVPADAVLADIDRLVADGARHITFSDPDFFNGPLHVMRIVRAMRARHPGLTFDLTTKISNLLRHSARLPELARSGCLFIVSAVESLSERVLARLDKGHDRDDVDRALDLVTAAGIALRPTWVPFTPWTRLEDYREMLDWIAGRGLVGHVDPVQYTIRLLVPPGSLLTADPEMAGYLAPLVADRFCHPWIHPDPAMDRLHAAVEARVRDATRTEEPAAETFDGVRDLAFRSGGTGAWEPAPIRPAGRAGEPPRLTEPWFC